MQSYQYEIDKAVKCLQNEGSVIVVPTDTTYGVICGLHDAAAVDRIYEIKGRDRSKPLIILGSEAQPLLACLANVSEAAAELARRFWPGPLTIVAEAAPHVPAGILSGGATVGLRVPDHSATRKVLSFLQDGYAASTSANPSGSGCPRTFEEAHRLMADKVDYVMPDCGEIPAGNESTIVDLTSSPPRILRVGALEPQLVMNAISQAKAR